MSLFIRRMFSTLYLSVIIEAKQCLFYGKVMRNGKAIKAITAEFDNDDPNLINDKIISYVKRLQKEYRWVYIALFLDSMGQGALPCRNFDEFRKFKIDAKNIRFTRVSDRWSIYADLVDIAAAKNKFKPFDIDLLYSPIALLHRAILDKKETKKTSLYIYNHKDCFALCIAARGEFKFGTFAKTQELASAIDDENSEFTKENIDDIDEFIAQIDTEVQSLDELDTLEDVLKTDSTGGEFADLDYDINMPASSDVASSVSIFGRDMSMYQYIVSALKEFYSNPAYESDFIEQIVIFDNAKTSATFLHYLENELMVQTAIYPVNSLKIMTDIMIDEIGA